MVRTIWTGRWNEAIPALEEWGPCASVALRLRGDRGGCPRRRKQPESYNWTGYGQADQVVSGVQGVGHKVPGVNAAWMRSLGERVGAVRIADEKRAAKTAPPMKLAEEAGKVRIGLGNQAFLRKVAPLKKQIGRLIKVACPDCVYLVRVTRMWLSQAGPPTCPCGPRMEIDQSQPLLRGGQKT